MTYTCDCELLQELERENDAELNFGDDSFKEAMDFMMSIDKETNTYDEDNGMLFPQPIRVIE